MRSNHFKFFMLSALLAFAPIAANAQPGIQPVIQNGVSGDAITALDLNHVQDSGTALSSLAPKASPTFTGTPIIPGATVTAPLVYTGTIPVPTGTGTPTIATGSTDTAGEVTAGSSATSVVITFSSVKTNAPFCVVKPQAQITSFAYTISTSAITITQTSTSGNLIDYFCVQH